MHLSINKFTITYVAIIRKKYTTVLFLLYNPLTLPANTADWGGGVGKSGILIG